DDDRYFDVVAEYAKQTPSDVLIRVTVHNRGPEAAEIHVLPQLWFRNTWSWGDGTPKPSLALDGDGDAIVAESAQLGVYRIYREGSATWLFTENETNPRRLFGIQEAEGYFKDAFHELLIGAKAHAVNPQQRGTKTAAHYRLVIPSGERAVVRL